MRKTRRRQQKTVWLGVVAGAVFLVSVWTLVTFALTEEQTVHIFPNAVRAEGWQNENAALEQALSDAALKSDFNADNSAYVIFVADAVPADQESGQVDGDAQLDEANVAEELSSARPVVGGFARALMWWVASVSAERAYAQEADSTEEPAEEPSEEAEPVEVPEPTNEPEAPVVQENEVEESDVASEEPVVEEEPQALEDIEPQESQFEEVSTDPEVEVEPEVAPPADDTSSTSEEVEENVAESNNEPKATSTDKEPETDEPSEPVPGSGGESTDEEEVRSDDVTICRTLGEDCHVLEFSGFGIGEALQENDLNTVQLRLSLGGRAEEGFTDDKVYVRYFHKGAWHLAGELSVTGELSNAANGGHYLFAMPEIYDWHELEDIRVQIEYRRLSDASAEVYVDGVWLDAAYEVSDELPLEDENVLADLAALEDSGRADILKISEDSIVQFLYSESMPEDGLVLRSNNSQYVGLGKTEMYIAVTNNTGASQTYDLQMKFPTVQGTVAAISKWTQNVPHRTTNPQYSSMAHFCEGGWTAVGDADEPGENASSTDELATASSTILDEQAGQAVREFQCTGTSEILACDSLNQDGTNCIVEDTHIGDENIVEYRGHFEPIEIEAEAPRQNPNAQSWFRRIFGGGDETPLPSRRGIQRVAEQNIAPGQTLYYRLDLTYPSNTTGVIEVTAEGEDESEGTLRATWIGGWQYRMPVTIEDEFTGNGARQILVSLDETQESFWDHVHPQGRDIRVMNQDASRELQFWIQEWNYIDQKAGIWVTVPEENLAASSTVFLYYGHPVAPPTGSAAETFSYSEPRIEWILDKSGPGTESLHVSAIGSEATIEVGESEETILAGETAVFDSTPGLDSLVSDAPISAVLRGGRAVPVIVEALYETASSTERLEVPELEYSSEYVLPIDTKELDLICSNRYGAPYIEVRSDLGELLAETNCDGDASIHAQDAGLDSFPPGTRIVSVDNPPRPFLLRADSRDLSGQIIWGPVQSRSDAEPIERLVIGAEEPAPLGAQFANRAWFAEVRQRFLRSLLAPAMNEFAASLRDFRAGEDATFAFTYKPQRNVVTRFFRSIFAERQFELRDVSVRLAGTEAQVKYEIEYGDDLSWFLKLAPEERMIRPGKYIVELTIAEGDAVYTDTFEFYWGVLAVNSDKSVYAPGEEAYLQMAALDDSGSTICDAMLTLIITSPAGIATDVPVGQSGSCGPNNVTDVPDYIAHYATGEPGEYTMELTHRNDLGEVVHRIEDRFEVRDEVAFSIERIGPTRIYPRAPYRMELRVTAKEDFTGTIVESVPEEFAILDADDAELSRNQGATKLSWDVELSAGETETISYEFDAPDISPYLFVLGPVEIHEDDAIPFSETRKWQIASDALGEYVEKSIEWTATNANTWETVDLSVEPFSVPANAVVEVAINNKSTNPERFGGVRAVGSSVDRRFELQEAEPQGEDHVVMHVQTDANSQIQHYAEDTTDVTFTLLGYWTSGTYVETYDEFDANTENSWADLNLSSAGVGDGDIVEVVMRNSNANTEMFAGVRANGSSLDRRVELHEAEAGGIDAITMHVVASGANGTIEAYAEQTDGIGTDIDHVVVGYWSVPPTGLEYVERFDTLTGPTTNSTWQDRTLSSFGVQSNGVAEVVFSNIDAANNTMLLGARTDGSSLARTFNVHEPESGGENFGRAHVRAGADAGATIELFSESTSDDAFRLVGHWFADNVPPDMPTFHDQPFESEKLGDDTPELHFSATDPDGTTGLVYELQFDDDPVVDDSPLEEHISSDESGCSPACFENVNTPADTSPFTEGARIRYQVQSSLNSGTTYYWRVRAIDEGGAGIASEWTEVQSFTYVEDTDPSQWFQTQDAQFEHNTLTNVETFGSHSVRIISALPTEAMVAYGEGTVQTPRYRIWNGFTWSSEQSALDVGGTIQWVVTRAGTQRDEYILGTQDASSDVNVQVYDGETDSWDDLLQVTGSISDTTGRGFDIAYETLSGDALVVYCDGDADPSYRVWDGSNWSGAGSINLSTGADCEWIKLASDPTSDEIILISRNTGTQYEAQVWDGSTWGNSLVMGEMDQTDHEGMAVQYEESGDQAVVVVSNDTASSFLWSSWNGSDWSIETEHSIGDDFEWGVLKRDVGTDGMALCYADQDDDLGIVQWTGDGWQPAEEFDTGGNTGGSGTPDGRPVSCEFETTAGRDGLLMIPYSDTAAARYQVYNGTNFSGEDSIGSITDSWTVSTIRTGDGKILATFHDDVNDRYDFSYWDGASWAAAQTLENSPSTNADPFRDPIGMSAQVFQPALGTILTDPVDFDLVPNQPTWGEALWKTTEPSGTNVIVQVLYATSSSCTTLVPDSALAGNSTGFDASESPLDLSGLSTSTYNQLCLQATLSSTNENTPTLNDWTLSWERQPFLTQSTFRWYVNANDLTPTDAWPSGEDDLSEDDAIQENYAPSPGDVLRLRIGILDENVAVSSDQISLKLQYAEGSTCSADLDWVDVGDAGSDEAWRGFDNAGASDGDELPSTLLSASDVAATYEEENSTALNPNQIDVNEVGEWDFVIEHNATSSTEYCFRVIHSDATALNAYSVYPQLVTNSPPSAPELEKMFDNEKTASTSPWFEFVGSDPKGDDLAYQIQIDNDPLFGSPAIDRNSQDNFAEFSNLVSTADKNPFTSGESVRFVPTSSLSNGTTYWWRVRARDPNGSNEWSDWSGSWSFTVDTSVTVTTWFQTTQEQFETDSLDDTETTASDSVVLSSGFGLGTTTGPAIDFDWRSVGNAWGSLSWNDDESDGDLRYRIEYLDSSGSWSRIPDTDLPGNSTGFDTSPVSLLGLDPTVYNQIRPVAVFDDVGGSPELLDWTISWGLAVAQPTQLSLFDNEKTGTTTPTFTFVSSDPQNDDLQYEISWSTSDNFSSATTKLSGTDGGFANTETPVDTSPFTAGEVVRFTIQSGDALTNGQTYWWRVRARDPNGGDTWSVWSPARSFTVDTSVTVSTWFQTTGDQFNTDTLSDTEVSGDSVQITSVIREAMVVYGEGTVQAPRYRIWNGGAWGAEGTAQNIGDIIYWLETAAAPTRDEYIAVTQGSSGKIDAQVYDGSTNTWGNVQAIVTGVDDELQRAFDVAYETTSGDAMVVACDDDDAVYRIWDGSSWSGESSITLASGNDCRWIQLASDPVSDEIILLVRDDAGSGDDYEAQVWDGSSWGDSIELGSINTTDNEGMTVEYEESGNQAVVVVSNGGSASFEWVTWSGSGWSSSQTTTIGDDFEQGRLKRDLGTDNMALCYIDQDTDIGYVLWNGSTFGSFTEMTTTGNDINGRPLDCEYETEGSRDGNVMFVYSETGNANYRVWNGSSLSGENSVSTITDSWELRTARTGDGKILMVAYDDTNTQYDFSYWSGTSWSAAETIEETSINNTDPRTVPIDIVARRFPSFTSGSVISAGIDFDDGAGPKWEDMSWSVTTPGASSVLMQVEYYNSSTDSWELVPDTDLPGNSTGFGSSPLDVSDLNHQTYNYIRLKANLLCDSGDCPTLDDWTVRWSEGIDVSGIARAYDEVTELTSGTVAIAVNGVVQSGKTGTITAGSAAAWYDTDWENRKRITIHSDEVDDDLTDFPVYVDLSDLGADFFSGVKSDGGDIRVTAGDGMTELPREIVAINTSNQTGELHFKASTISSSTDTNFYIYYGNSGASDYAAADTFGAENVWTNSYEAVYHLEEDPSSSGPQFLDATGNGHDLTAAGSMDSSDMVAGQLSGSALTFDGTDDIISNSSFAWPDAQNEITVSLWNNVPTASVKAAYLFGFAPSGSDRISAHAPWSDQNTYWDFGLCCVAGRISTSYSAYLDGWAHVAYVSAGNGGSAKAIYANGASIASAGSPDDPPTLTGFSIGNAHGVGGFSYHAGSIDEFRLSTTVRSAAWISTEYNNQDAPDTFYSVGSEEGQDTGSTVNWTIQNVTAFEGDVIHIWIDGVADSGEAVAVTIYDGVHDITGIELYQRHLTIGSDDAATVSNATLAIFDNAASGDDDISYEIDSNNDLTVCAEGSCSDAELYIKAGNTYRPDSSSSGNISTHDLENRGTLILDGNTVSVSGSWENAGTLTANTSSVIFTATSGTETVNSTGATNEAFNSVTFGQTSGTATWQLTSDLDVNGTLSISRGTLAPQGTASIFAGGNVTIGANGAFAKGSGTTTLDGLSVAVITDATSPKQDLGNLVIDGTSKIVQLGSDISATDLAIGSDDALDASTSNFDIALSGNFTNAGSFTARQGTVTFIATTSGHTINGGGSSFYDLVFNGSGGTWAFPNNAVSVTNDFTIASGTVTLPNGTTTVAGSFLNTGGAFQHNNGALNLTSAGAETIQTNGSNLYNLTFNGSGGSWSFVDTNATSSNNVIIRNGTVTFPSETFEIGGSLTRIAGAFAHNSGTVKFTSVENESIMTGPSTFYNLAFDGIGGTWTFTGTNATTTNDFSIVNGTTTMPSGTIAVGGSFTNAGTFSHNSGLVHFFATAGGKSIDPGASPFYDVVFDGPSGGWTVTGNATSTGDWRIRNASSFTLDSGTTIEVGGEFENAVGGSATTWTGSTLYLNSGSSFNINTKSNDGDAYGTLMIGANTDVRMWNSSSTAYSVDPTGSLYSQDHDSVDGDLYIFGEYVRASGTEYWSYDTDFDGTDLSGSERQVDVRIAGGSDVKFQSGSILEIEGIASATTTIAGQDGETFGLSVTDSTVNATYYAVQDTDQNGFAILGTSTIASLSNGSFTLTAIGGTSLAVASTTIDANPTEQISNVSFSTNFATSSTITTSDGEATFIFFDDFSDDLSKWSRDKTSGSFPEIPSGQDYVRSGGGSGSAPYGHTSLGSSPTYSSFLNNAVEYRYRLATQAISEVAIRGDFDANTGYKARSDQRSGQGQSVLKPPYADASWNFISGCTADSDVPSADTWYWGTVTAFGSSIKTFRDGDLKINCSDTQYSSAGEIALQNHFGSYSDFDWVGVRKFADPEPAHGAWGSEESIASGAFRKSHTIAGSTAGAQTDYVMRVVVHYGSGTDSGADVYCTSNCNTDFSDVRFTAESGEVLPYWREEDFVSSDFAVFWVQVDEIPASPDSATVYMYYGDTSGSNVGVIGTPISYWTFREHYGNFDGETFDSDPSGDPGNIRWEDSAFTITVSGHVYSDEGVTVSSACDGSQVVQVRVNGSGDHTSSCSGADGSFSIPNVSFVGDVVLTVYLDSNGGEQAVTVTQTPNGDITDLDLYEDRLIVRHEDTAPLTIADLTTYDSDQDADIFFDADLGTPNTLTVEGGNELIIWDNKTFAPGGNITLQASGSGDAHDGSIHIGDGATLIAAGTQSHSIGGSWTTGSGAAYSAANSTVTFSATTAGKSISPSSPFYDVVFNGSGGIWSIDADMVVQNDMTVSAGTVSGTGDITVEGGTIEGDGSFDMTGGAVTIESGGNFGGNGDWAFYDLTLGDGVAVGSTTKVGTGDIEVKSVLTVSQNHALLAGATDWTLTGSSTVFTIGGTFDPEASAFIYAGTDDLTVTAATYNDLLLAPEGAGSPTYTLEAGQFTVGDYFQVGHGTNVVTVDADANDPLITVAGDMEILGNATYSAAGGNDLMLAGSYSNAGVFTANDGGVIFNSDDTGETVDAGGSPFHNVTFNSATGGWTISANASSTGAWTLTAGTFTQSPGTIVEVRGTFTNAIGGANTTWTGATLYLNAGTAYTVNEKTVSDDYATLSIGANTDVSMWNSSASAYDVDGSGSLYSMDHANQDGDLYIWGDYVHSSGNGYWSYATDFDGTSLAGSERHVDVRLADNATTTLAGGTLEIGGDASASTTIAAQGSGTYALRVTGGTLDAEFYSVRDINSDGLFISGAPVILDLDNSDFELEIEGGTMMTVAGSAITANPLKTWRNVRFATSTGITSGFNVTATGSSGTSWRFTDHYGNLAGESFDSDPQGDPGLIIWDDSAADITVAGTVYSDEGSTVSNACDSTTQNVRLLIEGTDARTTSCDQTTGAYSFSNIVYNVDDAITVYLDTGGNEQAATVTVDPVTNILDMDLYEHRLIVRHEDVEPITIEDLSIYDSDQDSDILFNADTGTPNTLTLDAGSKLIVWDNKIFAPDGNVTIPAAGNGQAYDGSIEIRGGAAFVAASTESHTIGGSWTTGAGGSFTAANSTVTFTATDSGNTVDTENSSFYTLIFNGSGGSWDWTDATSTVNESLTITAGSVDLPESSLAIGASFENTGGSFSAGTSTITFTGAGSHDIELGGSDVHSLSFTGPGSWTFADTDATSTGDISISAGSVVWPSGTLAVGGSYENTGGSFMHTGELVLTSSDAGELLTLGGSPIGSVTFNGAGSWTWSDTNATTTGDVDVLQGGVTLPAGILAVGGSLTNQDSLNTNAGTLRFYATSGGHTIDSGGSLLSNVDIDGAGGGWTLTSSATTTGYFNLAEADGFTLANGESLEVQGIFTNSVGGAATDWAGSTLYLNSGTAYAINTKSDTGDQYAAFVVGSSTDIRMWNSSAATPTVSASSSLYSQDHANQDGDLYIWGEYVRTSGADHWSYATDFDGTALGGSSRQVDVRIAADSSVRFTGSTLNMVGASGNETTVAVQSTGTYSFSISGGTLNANHYQIRNTDAEGLNLSGSLAITDLSNGDFELGVEGGAMLTVAASVVNANPTETYTGLSFATSSGITTGFNVVRTGSTANFWRFTGHTGNYDGEDFDSDGVDECGSIRWEDSTCLEASQAHFRFRNDDGGEGAPDSEWFDQDWTARIRITVVNTTANTLTDHPVEVTIGYDSDMQTDFDDLRFTDDSGTTTIPYWIESFATASSATAWVNVPSIPANGSASIYVYYGNLLATNAEDGESVFTFFDDFEDSDIDEYSGDITSPNNFFDTSASFAYEGSRGLGASLGNTEAKTIDGIYRTDTTFAQGSTIRFFTYVDATKDDEPCTLFGVQSPGSSHENYAVCLDQFPSEQVVLAKNVSSNDTEGGATTLDSQSVTFTTGWYEVVIDWLTNDTINVTVYDDTGSTFATLSASDSDYTSGGMGFTFWFQAGGWDYYSVKPYVASAPLHSVGTEQGPGGATWKTDLDTALQNQEPHETFRLRISVENSGPEMEDQNFRLQYAPKGEAPTCGAVDEVAYNDVPIVQNCGSSPICMVASSQFANQDPTTPHLDTEFSGAFVAGRMVEDPDNETNTVTVPTNFVTEIEYAIALTDNATDNSYCLRTTDGGLPLDSYAKLPEITLLHLPVISNWNLNNDVDIALVEGTTTTVVASGTVTDLNGFEDISWATSTIYREGVGSNCSADANTCYPLAVAQCPLSNCAGDSCEVTCTAEMYYFAEPTDPGSDNEAESWFADVTVSDSGGNIATTTSVAVDVLTLWALDLFDGTINYGAVGLGEDTGANNASTTLENTGNDEIDIELAGTDLTAGESTIPVGNQKFATSTFTYSACAICGFLSGTSTAVEVDLAKPTSTSTKITDTIYWGIHVPTGVHGTTHTGQNVFFATGD